MKKIILAVLGLFLSLTSFAQDTCLGLEPPKGFAITDNTAEYYRIDAIDSTTPEVTSCPIVVNGVAQIMNGEGSAYDPFTDRYYVFSNSDLYYIDLSGPCDGSTNTYLVDSNTAVVGTSQGAEMAYDSTAMTAVLWVLDDALPQGFLRKLDPLTGAELRPGIPITGVSKVDGIAIDPATGIFYAQDDDVVAVYRIDTTTGAATPCFTIPPMDGEALSFGSDGRIYTEMDRGDTSRIIWASEIPPTCDNSLLTMTAVATFLTTTGDVENFGMNGAACFLAAPLYAHLTEFYGKVINGANELYWETAIELNHSHFILERSNGLEFEEIGIIPSQTLDGNSSAALQYNFRDEYPHELNYYRLKSVDVSGKVRTHRTISLNKRAESAINIFPNPATDKIRVDITQENLGEIQVSLYDLQGREMFNSGYLENNGNIVQDIDLSNLASGYYILKLSNGIGFDMIEKIIKQ